MLPRQPFQDPPHGPPADAHVLGQGRFRGKFALALRAQVLDMRPNGIVGLVEDRSDSRLDRSRTHTFHNMSLNVSYRTSRYISMASRRNLVKSFFRVFSYRMRCIKGETRYAPGFGNELGVAFFKCSSLSQPHRGRCCYAGRHIPRADRTGARGVAQGKGDQSPAEAFCRRQIRRGRNSFPSGAMASTWITSRPGSPDGHLGDAIHLSCLTSHRCKGSVVSCQDLHGWSFQESPVTSRNGGIAGSKRVLKPQKPGRKQDVKPDPRPATSGNRYGVPGNSSPEIPPCFRPRHKMNTA